MRLHAIKGDRARPASQLPRPWPQASDSGRLPADRPPNEGPVRASGRG